MCKRLLLILMLLFSLESCMFYYYEEPNEPTNREYSDGSYVDNSREDRRNNNRNNNENGNDNAQEEDFEDTNNETEENNNNTNNENESDALIINIDFFKQEKTNDTILIKSTENGGTVIFKIYVDNYSLSMYGFSIYDVDFYEFILDDIYCGYNSFSYYTTVEAKYKMVIKENNTHDERIVHGYWAMNNGYGGAYKAFHVYLIQEEKQL